MPEQPQPAEARAFVEAEQRMLDGVTVAPWTLKSDAKPPVIVADEGIEVEVLALPRGWDVAPTSADFNNLQFVAHVRTSYAQALDLIQQQADEIERLRARVGELEGEPTWITPPLPPQPADEGGEEADAPGSWRDAIGCAPRRKNKDVIAADAVRRIRGGGEGGDAHEQVRESANRRHEPGPL